MVNGDSEQIDLLKLSKKELKQLLSQISAREGEASAEAQRIRGLIAQAGKRTRTRLPQRRFGFPVQQVKTAQRQVMTARQEAREFITEGTAAIGVIKQKQAQLKEEKELVEDVRRARSIFKAIQRGTTGAIFGLETERQREFFRHFSAKQKALERESEIRRLVKRGILEKVDGSFEFTEEGISKIQAGEVDFSKFKFIKPPEITTIVTQAPQEFSVKVTDVEPKPKESRPPRGVVGGVVEAYKVSERQVSKVTKAIIPADFAKGVGTSIAFLLKEGAGKTRLPAGTKIKTPFGTKVIKEREPIDPLGRFVGGVAVGAITEVRERPVAFAVTFGAGAAIGATLKGVGFAAPRIAGVVGTRAGKFGRAAAKVFGISVGAGLTAAFVGTTAFEISKQERAEDIGVVVGRTGIQTAAVGIGSVVGLKAARVGIGRFRTLGGTEVPLKKIVDPAVLKGTKTFPEISPKTTIKEFKLEFFKPILPEEQLIKKPRVFTAKDVTLPELQKVVDIGKVVKTKSGVKTIKSEFAGQFGDPSGISLHFLRVSSEPIKPKGIKDLFKLDPFGSEPIIERVTAERLIIPKAVGKKPAPTKELYKEVAGLLGGRKGDPVDVIKSTKPLARKGDIVLPFIKSEKEGILVKGALKETTRKKFFIKFKGERVPIIETKTIKTPRELDTKFGVLGKLKERVKLNVKNLELTAASSRRAGSIDVSRQASSGIGAGLLKSSRLKSSKISTPKSITSSALRSSLRSPAVSRVSKVSSKRISSRRRPPSSRTPPSITRSIASSIRSPPSRPRRIVTSTPRISRITSRPRKTPEVTRITKLPLFKLQKKRLIPKKRKKPKFADDLAIVPDISARAAGITVKIPKSKLKGVASKRLTGLGLRAVPLIK